MVDEREPRLRVKQFGVFEIWRGDAPIPAREWPQRKTQTVFKVLLSEPGRAFTQDQLIDRVFPDLDADKAAKNLYNRISELRRVLEPGLERGADSRFVARVGQGGYLLSADAPCWIDTEAFREALEAARALHDAGDRTAALTRYQRAVDLYAGPYLAEDAYEEWTLSRRERFEERYVDALARLAECHAHLGQFARALECCRRALEAQPAREGLYRQKMTYHERAGDPERALQTFRDCAEQLRTHLDAEPAAETRALRDRIRQRKARPEPARDLDRPPTGAAPEPPGGGDAPPAPTRRRWAWPLALGVALVLIASGWWGLNAWNAPPRRPSVAVLPFVDMTVRSELQFGFSMEDFSDGITEELTNALSRVEGVRVPSRTSAFSYEDSGKDIRTIGRELNVGAVLEGSVRRSASRMRVTASLIDVADGHHLWTETFETEVGDVFTIFDEVTSAIVAAVLAQLGVPDPQDRGGAVRRIGA